jgi:hypothetical protein
MVRISEQEYCATDERFVALADLIRDNPDDEELMSVLDRLRAGETVCVGGGAQPLTVLRVVREEE